MAAEQRDAEVRGVHFPCASRIAPQRQSGRIRFALKLLAAIGRGFEVDLDRGVKAEVVDAAFVGLGHLDAPRSEEHTSELQSLMRNSYAVFCWNKKKRLLLHR